MIASLLLAGYGFLAYATGRDPTMFLIWFAGAIVAHDLVLLPLYSVVDRVAHGAGTALRPPRPSAGRTSILNHLRVPFMLSGLMFVVWFPLILGRSERTYIAVAGQPPADYLARWLLLSGVLFAASALLYAARLHAEPGAGQSLG